MGFMGLRSGLGQIAILGYRLPDDVVDMSRSTVSGYPTFPQMLFSEFRMLENHKAITD